MPPAQQLDGDGEHFRDEGALDHDILLPVPRNPAACQLSTISQSARGTTQQRSRGGPLVLSSGAYTITHWTESTPLENSQWPATS